jgi:cystathionine gamma-synthase
MNIPLEMSSTYRAGGDVTYGREGNASWTALEEVLGELEGGTAVTFASGMAAISAVLETLPVGATVVISADAYNGTRRFLQDVGMKGRLDVRGVDATDTVATLEACEGAQLLWLETPSNPMLDIADLGALVNGAHQRRLAVVVDNTFATPLLQRPLDFGADVVVHSVTKLLSGHSDLVLGAAISRSTAWVEALRSRRSLHGAIPGPFETYLALRGIRTLGVRLQRSQVSASVLAERLEHHPAITTVRYPGLQSHPGRSVAARQMDGFGTILSFELEGGAAAADAFCEAVQVAVPATSLGGVDTMVERRAKWAGEDLTPAGLVRVSVGLEHVDDLWHDFELALEAAGAVPSAGSVGPTGVAEPSSPGGVFEPPFVGGTDR